MIENRTICICDMRIIDRNSEEMTWCLKVSTWGRLVELYRYSKESHRFWPEFFVTPKDCKTKHSFNERKGFGYKRNVKSNECFLNKEMDLFYRCVLWRFLNAIGYSVKVNRQIPKQLLTEIQIDDVDGFDKPDFFVLTLSQVVCNQM